MNRASRPDCDSTYIPESSYAHLSLSHVESQHHLAGLECPYVYLKATIKLLSVSGRLSPNILMDSPQSQVTDSHPEFITLPDRCWYPSNKQPVAPSFLSHDAHHGHSLGANIVVETRLLTESSSKTGATFKKTITQLSHPGLDDHENAFSPESLARTPSTATYVDVFPTDAWNRKISFEKEAEVSTPSLEFEHVTQRLLTTYFIYFVCGWGDGGQSTV